MSWPETLTVPNPDFVDTLEPMPDGYSAAVVRDSDAQAPDWDGIGYVLYLGYSYRDSSVLVSGDYEDTGAEDILAAARELWDTHRDWSTVARLLRFHGASSVDWSSGIDRDGTVLAVVTRAQADAWGCPRASRRELASQALGLYRQWAEGEVYGVVVTRESDGETESLWGIYDDSAGQDYLRDVAHELAAELGYEVSGGRVMSGTVETFDLGRICQDCAFVTANGEDSCEDPCEHGKGLSVHTVLSGDTEDNSSEFYVPFRPCPGCGTTLAGTWFEAVELRPGGDFSVEPLPGVHSHDSDRTD
jgi:hypothetical protein